MKKLIFSLSVLVVSGAFGQKMLRMQTFQDLVKVSPKTSNTPISDNEKVINTLWQDNFNDPSTWTIDNNGQTGAQFGWNINSTSQGWWSTTGTGMSSTGTSGGNNAELVNGNPTVSPATQALNVVYTMTTALPINVANLGGTNQVSLQFKQFGARFNDLQEMQISTDGTNFISVGNNLDKTVLSQSGGSQYPNPDTKTINLATYLSANPTAVWIRFRWTTNYPQSATNANVWITYGWYIDDVKIISNPSNDLSIKSSFWGTAGLNYYQIPTTQVAPIGFTSRVFNEGVSAQSSSFLKADILSGATNVFTGTSLPTSIPSLDSADLDVTTEFTPPATVANYTLKRNIILGYLPNGQILTGSISNGGNGYTSGNGVSVSGGTGTGATLNITASPNGVVASGTTTIAGTGYSSATGVATSTTGSGTGLTLDIVANVGIGDITGVTIANGGTNYAVNDVVAITGGNNDATYTVSSVTGGTITSVTLNNGGSGYTVGNVLTIAGGSATYTVGTVTNNTEIADELPNNNTISDVNFGVTNYVYARDNGVWAGSTSNGTDGFEVGNLFDIWTNQTLNGLTVRLEGGTSGTATGTQVFVKLYEVDSTGFVFIVDSDPYTVASNSTNTLITIPFINPVNLVANKTYLAVVGSYDATLKVSNAGNTEPQTSFFQDFVDGTWYYTTSIPVVRMNFDPSVGLEQLSSDLSSFLVYPNPTNQMTNVEFELLNSSNVSYQVTDLSGKIIMDKDLGTLNQGLNKFTLNVSDFNSGFYFISINNNGSKATKRFVKN